MNTQQPVQSIPAITQDIPCITCGYNLRGLDPTRLCPECGTPIQRSVDARMKLIMSSPRTWARLVLGGLTLWLLLTPYFIAATLSTCVMFADRNSALPWISYPGPRIWATHLLVRVQAQGQPTAVDYSRLILALIMVVAVHFLTWPRDADGNREPPFNLRAAARWTCTIAIGGFWMLGINYWSPTGSLSPVLGTMAILGAELPCTLLTYLHLSVLARRLDLLAEAEWLWRCGWIAAMVMTLSVVLITLDFPPRTGYQPLHIAFFWCFGAIVCTTAVVATGSVVRLTTALWPLATGRRA